LLLGLKEHYRVEKSKKMVREDGNGKKPGVLFSEKENGPSFGFEKMIVL
jgi:hypothetical protein